MSQAIRSHNLARVKQLLDGGYPVNGSRTPPLRVAVAVGDVPIVKLLLGRGANANVTDRDGMTPLFTAAFDNSTTLARLLLRHHVSVNHREKGGGVALGMCSSPAMARLLIDAGATVDVRDRDGATPLQAACEGGYLPVEQTLVEAGANVHTVDNGGENLIESTLRSAAVSATGRGVYARTLRFLVQHGVNPGDRDRRGKNSFDVIKDEGLDDLADCLH